jgi:rhamnose utilization protein RhaD (predicted bifunctional aldolase and dehydrogenase)/NAD(P)-dependent dehydrogenase (short-subunit alcohol dehydrogenase family)
MKSHWNDSDAKALGDDPLGLRVYTSRLLGAEPSLVLHGGGNTSVKTTLENLHGEHDSVIYVKGSGWDLATIEREGFAPVRLDPLRRLADLPSLSDRDMVRAQRTAMLDPDAPTPSVEAILHAIIPFDFVDHTHADAVVTISNTEGGESRIREIYGDRVLVVPYVMPGFVLAKAVADLTRSLDWSKCEGMVLLHHGVFTFADDARTSYERMIGLVTKAEDYLSQHAPMPEASSAAKPLPRCMLPDLAELRHAIGKARGKPVITQLETNGDAATFSARADVTDISTRGPLTPDHVIRTKPVPLVASGEWRAGVDRYVARYSDYFARHASPGLTQLDPAPRWVVWPEVGLVTTGSSVREAAIVADIARHTTRAIALAEQLGGWRALPENDLFEVEYWELEQAKLKAGRKDPPLAGRVALVTGAASGIGRATAQALHAAGASVVGTDVNPKVGEILDGEGLVGIVADATDPEAVEASIDATIRQFGGLDILVTNAGVFSPSNRIEEISDDIWDQSLALNLSGHLYVIRAAVPYLRLGFSPSVVVIGSKNVPAPGLGAAAYSAAKAGLTQLARVAALELGKDGIRVNVLHPHAVFDTGAWTPEVVDERALQYGMTSEEYIRNNLLGVEITTNDVAAAVLALAGPTFAKTTGAQIPIDGGSDRVV